MALPPLASRPASARDCVRMRDFVVVVVWPLDIPGVARTAELVVLERDQLHSTVRLCCDEWLFVRETAACVRHNIMITSKLTAARFLCALVREVDARVTESVSFDS